MGASIYPNPVDDLLHIRVEKGLSARMFDLSGKVVKTINLNKQETTLSVSDLEAGEYLIEITTSERKGVYKLIKK